MTETTCPTCAGEVAGIGIPKGIRRNRHQPAPDTSTAYCMTCHIGLSKRDGLWRRSSPGMIS